MLSSTLKEKKVHGNSMFPLNVYLVKDSKGKHSVSCHWHDNQPKCLKQGMQR